jgi:hypothetical protein
VGLLERTCQQTITRCGIKRPIAYWLRLVEDQLATGAESADASSTEFPDLQTPAFVAEVARAMDLLPAQHKWQRILAELSSVLAPSVYATWCAPSVLLASADVLLVVVPSPAHVVWLQQRCMRHLTAALHATGETRPVRLVPLADLVDAPHCDVAAGA